MESISDQKALLRKALIMQRNALSKEEWESKSQAIGRHILQSKEYKNADVIHCFVSMNERFEVDTHSLINTMLSSGKKVVIPITDFENGVLKHTEIIDFSKLQPNKWGVLEPKEIEPVAIDTIDLILVPLLGADLNGNRLGYGKGFYDRFLKEISAPAFGLIMSDFIIKKIPIDTFDKKLKGLFSEKGIKYT